MSYQVLLVDDRTLIREGIKALIEQGGEFRVVAEAENAMDALELSRRLYPDVVMVNVGIPCHQGLDTVRQLLGQSPDQRVVMLSMADDEESVITALRCGARGLVLRQSSPRDLMEALRTVASGGTYFSAQISDHLTGRIDQREVDVNSRLPVAKRLTGRELEVLRLITAGRTSKEIAERLSLSVETVRSYRKSMMRKLGVKNIASLISVAIQEGLTRWTQTGSSSYT